MTGASGPRRGSAARFRPTSGSWVAAAVALASGGLWALCFGREPFGVVPLVALVPLFLLLSGPRPTALVYLHGLGFWLVSIPWIAPTLRTYGALTAPVAATLFVLFAAFLALFYLPLGWAGARLWERGGWRALVAVPALAVGLEWIRGNVLSGFPWNLAGYAWIEVPGALPLAAWIGPYGVSLLVMIHAAAVALAIARRRWRIWSWTVLGVLLLLAWGARWGVPPSPPGPATAVRLLQPSPPILTEWDEAVVRRSYGELMGLSEEACDRVGALVLWPESAAWPFSFDRHAGLRRDVRRLSEAGCPLLFNSAAYVGDRVYNSAYLVADGEVAGRYDKRHLVPFGEYLPLAGWIPLVDSLAREAGNFSAGERLELLPLRQESLALSICYEITFPEEVAEGVRQGASVLVTVTNDGWYGDSYAPWQHYRAARFRAAENRRPLLRAALTGVSAIVGPDGRVVEQLGVGERGVIRGAVVGRSDRSPYSRFPGLVPWSCLALSAFAIFLTYRSGGP